MPVPSLNRRFPPLDGDQLVVGGIVHRRVGIPSAIFFVVTMVRFGRPVVTLGSKTHLPIAVLLEKTQADSVVSPPHLDGVRISADQYSSCPTDSQVAVSLPNSRVWVSMSVL